MKERLRQFLLQFLGLDFTLQEHLNQSIKQQTLIDALTQQVNVLAAKLAEQVTELDEVEGVGKAGFCHQCGLRTNDLSSMPIARQCERCGHHMSPAAL